MYEVMAGITVCRYAVLDIMSADKDRASFSAVSAFAHKGFLSAKLTQSFPSLALSWLPILGDYRLLETG